MVGVAPIGVEKKILSILLRSAEPKAPWVPSSPYIGTYIPGRALLYPGVMCGWVWGGEGGGGWSEDHLTVSYLGCFDSGSACAFELRLSLPGGAAHTDGLHPRSGAWAACGLGCINKPQARTMCTPELTQPRFSAYQHFMTETAVDIIARTHARTLAERTTRPPKRKVGLAHTNYEQTNRHETIVTSVYHTSSEAATST